MRRGDTLLITTHLVVEECCACGMVFGLPDDYQRVLREHPGQPFYCPAGHGQHYTGKTDAEKLRIQLAAQVDRVRFWQEEHARERRSHSATKGQLTRARRRIGRGVCPNCNRSFPALAEHMRTEHPELALDEEGT